MKPPNLSISMLTFIALGETAWSVERAPIEDIKIARDLGAQAFTTGLSVSPSTVGEMSDLYINNMIQAAASASHTYVFYPGDCFVIWFDLFDSLPDWVPVPNEIDTCEFDRGEITCERLSDTAIKLNIGTYVAKINGYVGQIQNIPTTELDGELMTVNRIDFYDECGIDASNMDTIVPEVTTPIDKVYTIEISVGNFEEASVAISGELIGETEDDYLFTVEFTPVTPLDDEGWINIYIPLWYTFYDITTGELIEQYSNEEEAFSCSSDNFGEFDLSQSTEGIIKLVYTEIIGSNLDPVVIVCTNWRNPIAPGTISGFGIRTYDDHGDLLDKSDSLDLDATNLQPDVILDEHISFSVSVPAGGQISDYTFTFEVDIPMESTGECFVKYTFPEEFDVSNLNVDSVQGSGMYIDASGSVITFESSNLKYNLDERWIALPGCAFNPMDRTTEELVNFEYNIFTATFKNIVNPTTDAISPLSIEVYKNFDESTLLFENMITSTTSFVIPYETYTIEGGEITDAKITTSSSSLGQSVDNFATISFTTISGLDQPLGVIKIITPIWAIFYDTTLKFSVIEYPIGDLDDTSCTSDAFTTIDISDSTNDVLIIKYTEMLTDDLAITITCNNWRNPNLPEEISGFSILTFDQDGDHPLDYSTMFSIDGTGLVSTPIDPDTFTYQIDSSFPSEPTNYKLSFKTENHIDSDTGCYVKYTFPPEIDISQIDMDDIQGQGMFVDKDGAIHSFDDDKIWAGDNWITLQGCGFDLAGKVEDQMVNWAQNEYTVVFKNVINPSVAADTSPFTIEIFHDWGEEEENVGASLLADTSVPFIPVSAYEIIGDIIEDVLISTSDTIVGTVWDNIATIQFTPATLLPPSKGKIELTTPEWASIYLESLNQQVLSYPISDESFFCYSSAFTTLVTTVDGNQLLFTYTDLTQSDTSQITIHCENWKNPIAPEIVDGFIIKTYATGVSDVLIDESNSFSQDASGLQAQSIDDDSFNYAVSSSFKNDLSEYQIEFEIQNAIQADDGCYVKYTFPVEIDIQGVDLTNIQGSGLFVDENGDIKVFASDEIISGSQWITLKGCGFDPEDKTEEQLENFDQYAFKATFKDLINPSTIIDTSDFTLEVFKEWDLTANEGLKKLSFTTTPIIKEQAYEKSMQLIEDASIITSSSNIASVIENIATISFTPKSGIPNASGRIEIETPVWGSLLDADLQSSIESYPISDPDFSCASDSFETMTFEVDQGLLSISYQGLTGEQTDSLTIICTNWRNPIEAELIEGFDIRTYDIDSDIIDLTMSFAYDGNELQDKFIDEASFVYQISSSFPSDRVKSVFSFEISNPIDLNDGCIIKFTFPEEMDISNIDLTDIQGSGLLASEDGSTQIFSSDKIMSGDQWIALRGCDYESQEVSVIFQDIINPERAEDTSTFLIEMFVNLNSDLDNGFLLIDSTDEQFISASQYEIIGGTINDASITTSAQNVASFQGNVATITFTPTSGIPFSSGRIEIETPLWASLYDSDLNLATESYQISDSDFECSSDSFLNIVQSIEFGKLSIEYTDLINEQTELIQISCTNWRNPILPELVEGYMITTYDIDSNVIDTSEAFAFDGTALNPVSVDDSTFSYEISSSFPRDETEKVISFELSNPLEFNDGCYIKITFPEEIDISNMNFDDITGSGLLANVDGTEQMFTSDKIMTGDQWIALKGCEYESQEVSVVFQDIINPEQAEDTSTFLIEIFVDLDSDLENGFLLIDSSDEQFVPASLYEIVGGIITDASITTSATTAATFAQNIATITFTPISGLPVNSGMIKIETPVWASLYDSDLSGTIESYQISDSDFECSSDSFVNIVQTIDEGILTIEYTELVNEQTDPVIISCTNWRNPLLPEVVEGYLISTYDINLDAIDVTEPFSYDGTILTSVSVDDSTFTYDISSSFPRDETEKVISFELDNPLEFNDGCFIKVTFPEQIDISNINLFEIQGSGLLANVDGTEQIFTSDKMMTGDQWIALQGCEYESQEVSILFKDIINPGTPEDTSTFLIEIFVNIDSDLENGFILIDSSDEQFIPGSQYEIIGETISGPTITTSSTELGVSASNIATITFTPATLIPISYGVIEIETPVWASLYDLDLDQMVDSYPSSDPEFYCTSQSFSNIVTDVLNEKIQLSYSDLLNEQDAQIEIKCAFWKNPIYQQIVEGFSIKTYDVNNDLIDDSNSFALDAQAYTIEQLDQSKYEIDIGISYLSEYTTYTISFEMSNPIEPSGGCYVMYTFPPEIDISQMNLANIRRSGLFVDQDGAAQTLFSDQISIDGQTIIVKGCSVDLTDKTAGELLDFSLSEFIISFENLRNPIPPLDGDLSTFSIEVFSSWDFENNVGLQKMAATESEVIPSSQYELAGGQISISLDKAIAGEVSSYNIIYASEFQKDSSEGCIVKFTFPEQIDATNLDLNYILAKRMFTENGDEVILSETDFIHNLDSGESPQWIAIYGCKHESDSDIALFNEDFYEVTFFDIKNPATAVDTSPFIIQLYESWDQVNNEAGILLSERADFILQQDRFALEGGIMITASITMSQPILGFSDGNEATIIFFPFDQMVSDGIIVIETPIWASGVYDEDLDAVLDQYYFGEANFRCTSDSFTSIITNFEDNIMTIYYTESLDPTGPQIIKCTNWRSPILPEVVTGFFIITKDMDEDIIDFSSDLIQIDASEFLPMPIKDESFEYFLSHQHAHELSDYTITFDAGIQIDAQGGCYVKYIFPDDLDVSSVDLTTVQGQGMFVDLNGDVRTFAQEDIINNFASESTDPKFMVLPGCSIVDLENKSPDQLQNFSQKEFTVMIEDILNPPVKEDTPPFVIQIYKSWDEDLNQGVDLLAESTTFYIPMAAFEHEGGIIEDPSITTSISTLGAQDGNIATIIFTPASTLAQGKGYIEILTPLQATLQNSETLQAQTIYPNTGVTSCSCPSFSTIDISESEENALFIFYTDLIGDNTQTLTITCTNWRNPIIPEMISGFSIMTMDAQKYIIDETEEFSYDGQALESVKIDRTDITYTTFLSLNGDLYGLLIEFESSLDIQSPDGCFVKYSFPSSMSASDLTIDTIEATKMFVDSDGIAQSPDYSSIVNQDDDGQTWFVIEGCQFDFVSKSPEESQEFSQNVFKITLEGITGLDVSDGIKPITIQIYHDWDTDTNSGSVLLAESLKWEVPKEAFELSTQSSPLNVEAKYIGSQIILDGDLSSFEESGAEDQFKDNLALVLGISSSNIEILEVSEESLIIDYNLIIDDSISMSAKELLEFQKNLLQTGDFDLGFPLLEFTSEILYEASQSNTLDNGEELTLTEEGQSSTGSLTLGAGISRVLDASSYDDNCVMCQAYNEQITKTVTDNSQLWSSDASSNFVFTAFCELPDFSASRCCQIRYNANQEIDFYGSSRINSVCTQGAAANLCSFSKVQFAPTLDNYFQMYQTCVDINQRFLGEVNAAFSQFKGQGSADKICGESTSITVKSTKQQKLYLNKTDDWPTEQTTGFSAAESAQSSSNNDQTVELPHDQTIDETENESTDQSSEDTVDDSTEDSVEESEEDSTIIDEPSDIEYVEQDPVVISQDNLSTTITLYATLDQYDAYGGDSQLISDISSYLQVDLANIEVISSQADEESNTYVVTYDIIIYETDQYTPFILKMMQTNAYLRHEIQYGAIEILKVGFSDDDMIISLTDTLIVSITVDATQDSYDAYGGNDQFIDDLTIAINSLTIQFDDSASFNKSAVEIQDTIEIDQGFQITYGISLYSDDPWTYEEIKEAQTEAYILNAFTFGDFQVLELGYGSDRSEMIVQIPILTDTLESFVVLDTDESSYEIYGGDEQLLLDLAASLTVSDEYITIVSLDESEDGNSLTVVYSIDVYDQDDLTIAELKQAQNELYLANLVALGEFDILEMGYSIEDMVIELTGTLVNQVTLNASLDDYTSYGGNIQFITDLSQALDINPSSIEVKSVFEQEEDQQLIINYDINIYSEDEVTKTQIKIAQTFLYELDEIKFGSFEVLEMGYGTDRSEMIIFIPILEFTLESFVVIATDQESYESYGGDDQLKSDLAVALSVNIDNILIDSVEDYDDGNSLKITYSFDVYDQDLLTETELKQAQTDAYLAYLVSIGDFEILEMGYSEDDMVIEKIGTLVNQLTLDATEDEFLAYGGYKQLIADLSSSIDIDASSVVIVSVDKIEEEEQLLVIYNINVYSDDSSSLEDIKITQTDLYEAQAIVFGNFEVLEMGYGIDRSEMIISLPQLVYTMESFVVLATDQESYESYGGDDQLISDLAAALEVDIDKISIDSVAASDIESFLTISYSIGIFDQDLITETELLQAQTDAYLSYQVTFGDLYILEMGYTEDDMVIEKTGTLVIQLLLDATEDEFIAYGGKYQLTSDISSALDVHASSVVIVSAVENDDEVYLEVIYDINIYSDDERSLEDIKTAQNIQYLTGQITFGTFEILAMGYGTDQSDMIITIPVVISTIESFVVLDTDEDAYETYGSDEKFIQDVGDALNVPDEYIRVNSVEDYDDGNSLKITYSVDVYDQDLLTETELKQAQSDAYLAYLVTIGDFEILQMGYSDDEMVIEMTGTIVNQVTLNTNLANYIYYGGDEQFIQDISSSLDILPSSIEVVSVIESEDSDQIQVNYDINIYSDDETSLTQIKATQTSLYLANEINLGSFEVLEMGYGSDRSEMIITIREYQFTMESYVILATDEASYENYGGDTQMLIDLAAALSFDDNENMYVNSVEESEDKNFLTISYSIDVYDQDLLSISELQTIQIDAYVAYEVTLGDFEILEMGYFDGEQQVKIIEISDTLVNQVTLGATLYEFIQYGREEQFITDLSQATNIDASSIIVVSTEERQADNQLVVIYNINIYSDDALSMDEIKTAQTDLYLNSQIPFGSFEVLEMGYGIDQSEMIIEIPILTDTIESFVVLLADEDDYRIYGGDDQFMSDLSANLGVDSEKIFVDDVDESDDGNFLTIEYYLEVYDQDLYTGTEIKQTQTDAYLEYTMTFGDLEVLEMGYNEDEMIIELTGTLVSQITIDASYDIYTSYGGDSQFISDLSTALEIDQSSIIIVESQVLSVDKQYYTITYDINMYSDDASTSEQIKETQTAKYLDSSITFGDMAVLDMGYGTDGTEMIIEIPIYQATFVSLVVLDTSDAGFQDYGGEIQFIADIASLLSIDELNVRVDSSTESDDAASLSIVYSIDVYDQDTLDEVELEDLQTTKYIESAMIFGDLAVLEFGYGADREIMIIEIPIETLVIQVQLDYGTDYGSYISDSSFETKLETAMGLDSTVDIVVQSTEDLATTSLIVNYEIHIYANSSETYDTIEAIQDQLYKDAVAGTVELLLGGQIYNMCYDDCVGTYVIYEGEEARQMTSDAFGSFRRLTALDDNWLSAESLCLLDINIESNETESFFEFQVTGIEDHSENINRFYIVDTNYDGEGGSNISPLIISESHEDANDFTISDPDRFKLLSVLDFANEDINMKIRYGLHLDQLLCNIRIDTDYETYMSEGGADTFINDMSNSLGISADYVDVIQLTPGSVISDYVLQTDANSEFSLTDLAQRQDDAFANGQLDLGAPILSYTPGELPPEEAEPVFVDPEEETIVESTDDSEQADSKAKSLVITVIGIVAGLIIINIFLVVLYKRNINNQLTEVKDAETIVKEREQKRKEVLMAEMSLSGDSLKDNEKKYKKVKDESYSMTVESPQKDETRAIIELVNHQHSEEKFISPEKTSIKQESELEGKSVSQFELNNVPIDIEARGIDEDMVQTIQDEAEQPDTKAEQKQKRKQTIKDNLDKLGFKVKGPKMFKRDKTRKKQFDMAAALDKIQQKNQLNVQVNNFVDE